MKNLVLIGMPSSGKSTAGVLLAKKIGYSFVDCDLLIQNAQKALLSEIIEREGAEGFIKIEEEINAALCVDRHVVATGGSVIYGARAMEHLRKIGKVVYLRLSVNEVERRVGNLEKRGVVMRGNISTIKELCEGREPLYEKYADEIVECDGQTIDDTVAALIEIAEKMA